MEYKKYQDSSIEFIGKIPNTWKLKKVKRTTYVKGRIGWKGLRSEDYLDEGPYLITGTDFRKNGEINWASLCHVSNERYDEDPFIQVQKDDVLITKDGTIGKVVFVNQLRGPTCLNSGIFITRPLNNEYNSRFFYHVLNSSTFQAFIEYNSNGSTIQHLFQNVFYDFIFPIPSLSEQENIISYLDEKTSIIDDLIQKKFQKIELLKEFRRSIIQQAVTKGLNPDAQLKDSDVEWIGKIPGQWEIKKLKYSATIVYGISPNESTYNDEGNGIELINGPVEYSETDFGYTRSLKWTTDPVKIVPKDSLLFCLRGSTTGRMNITHKQVSIGRGVCAINSKEDQNYTLYCMIMIRNYIQDQLSGSTFPSVTKDDVDNFILPTPPISEQKVISKYLNSKTSEIDSHISLESHKIELLKEYRQSLISEVVTGKIDLREN